MMCQEVKKLSLARFSSKALLDPRDGWQKLHMLMQRLPKSHCEHIGEDIEVANLLEAARRCIGDFSEDPAINFFKLTAANSLLDLAAAIDESGELAPIMTMSIATRGILNLLVQHISGAERNLLVNLLEPVPTADYLTKLLGHVEEPPDEGGVFGCKFVEREVMDVEFMLLLCWVVVSVLPSVKPGVMYDHGCCNASTFLSFNVSFRIWDSKEGIFFPSGLRHLEELWLKSSLQKTSHSNSFEVFQKYGSLVMTSGFPKCLTSFKQIPLILDFLLSRCQDFQNKSE